MKQKIVISLIGLMLFLNCFVNYDENTIALITSLQGKITIVRGTGEKLIAVLGSVLYKNDNILVGVDGKATVYFMDGQLMVLNSGDNVTIGASSETSTLPDKRSLKQNSLVAKTTASLSATKKADIEHAILTPSAYRSGEVVPAAPSGFVFTESPEFIWIDSTKNDFASVEKNYVLIVMDEDSNEILRLKLKGKTNFVNRFKSEKPFLKKSIEQQKFYWDIYVEGKEPKKGLQVELDAAFILIGSNESKNVENSLNDFDQLYKKQKIDFDTYCILSALMFKEKKLYCDAATRLDNLISRSNLFLFPYQELAWIYSQLGKNSGILVKYYSKQIELLSSK